MGFHMSQCVLQIIKSGLILLKVIWFIFCPWGHHTLVSVEERASTQHVSSGCTPTPQYISTSAYGAEERSYTGGLVQDIRGFLLWPSSLIMTAPLYFEEKVHRKKLLRADAIPLLITTKKCYFVDLIIMVLSTFE